MPESISKPKSKVSWVKGVHGLGSCAQWVMAINVLYAQEITKTDLCLGKHNSSREQVNPGFWRRR